tara:strand:- start:868 stop:978 length:111 start_codon:yes stop_codon:yes gene_type:complete
MWIKARETVDTPVVVVDTPQRFRTDLKMMKKHTVRP